MHLDENWAVAEERIRAFFREQPDMTETADGFDCPGCTVRLIPLTGEAMGRWAIPRTRVIFEGEDEAVRSLHRRFFLRFLSAGG